MVKVHASIKMSNMRVFNVKGGLFSSLISKAFSARNLLFYLSGT